ncbi:MAG: hypothetical protein N2645_15930 [Clostridia bacterium]|nr:hypothetical protein [Clostridia bacterium]
MLYSYYHKLFWGFILLLIDIRIQNVDVLPDFIGYILITYGLTKLALQHPSFGKARYGSFLLIFFSLPEVYQVTFQSSEMGYSNTLIYMMIFSLILSFIHLGMVYFIFQAIIDLSMKNGRNDLSSRAKIRLNAYFIIYFLSLFSTPFSININNDYMLFFFIPLIPIFIVELLLIGLIRTARDTFSTSDPNSPEAPFINFPLILKRK